MYIKLMYITNNITVARLAEQSGVNRIFIDLELRGKEKRQGHLNTVISHHAIDDIHIIDSVISNAEILVRINPIYDDSYQEINSVINQGADIIMLPYFKNASEVEEFLSIVDGRVKTCLLCETPEAVINIDEILALKGIDEIHIGLNDLHLGYGKNFMFELLVDGTVEKLARKFKKYNIPFGFGGIAALGKGDIPAEYILAEHYRLGSCMTILSRSFCNVETIRDPDEIKSVFHHGINKIRQLEDKLIKCPNEFFEKNRIELYEKIRNVASIK